jgi:tRNA(fMet)-specific endonuclease VapC
MGSRGAKGIVILLDTDHITVLERKEDKRHLPLKSALQRRWDEGVATTVITVEEQFKGWLAKIHRAEEVEQELDPYSRLTGLISFFARWRIEQFDQSALAEFKNLKQRVRVGTQDLKIASIALIQNALLLSANLKDFEKVPGLRVENWLE